MKSILLIVLSSLIPSWGLGQTLSSQRELIEYGFETTSVGGSLTGFSANLIPVISIHQYSTQQRELQKTINARAEAIVTAVEPIDSTEWTALDKEDITPFTWKWIDLTQLHVNGDITSINLRRPFWWLKKMRIERIGDSVYLNLPEIGLEGMWLVKNIRPNQLDTRFLDWSKVDGNTLYPITGKFHHISGDVYELEFDKNKVVRATGSHPFWSVTSSGWTSVRSMKEGEAIKTHAGQMLLKKKRHLPGRYDVYNLEVYRAHTFFVSENCLLVHNTCLVWDQDWYHMVMRTSNEGSWLAKRFMLGHLKVSWIKSEFKNNFAVFIQGSEKSTEEVNELLGKLIKEARIDPNEPVEMRILGLSKGQRKQLKSQGGYEGLEFNEDALNGNPVIELSGSLSSDNADMVWIYDD